MVMTVSACVQVLPAHEPDGDDRPRGRARAEGEHAPARVRDEGPLRVPQLRTPGCAAMPLLEDGGTYPEDPTETETQPRSYSNFR